MAGRLAGAAGGRVGFPMPTRREGGGASMDGVVNMCTYAMHIIERSAIGRLFREDVVSVVLVCECLPFDVLRYASVRMLEMRQQDREPGPGDGKTDVLFWELRVAILRCTVNWVQVYMRERLLCCCGIRDPGLGLTDGMVSATALLRFATPVFNERVYVSIRVRDISANR